MDNLDYSPKKEDETKLEYVKRLGMKHMKMCEGCEFNVKDVDLTACIECVKDYLESDD